jgi:hypothetical protein
MTRAELCEDFDAGQRADWPPYAAALELPADDARLGPDSRAGPGHRDRPLPPVAVSATARAVMVRPGGQAQHLSRRRVWHSRLAGQLACAGRFHQDDELTRRRLALVPETDHHELRVLYGKELAG